MTHPFHELVIGGVLFAPALTYGVLSLAIVLLLRPILRRIGFYKLFSHPPIAALSLYVVVFGLVTAFV
jgi:hypothetical protein